MYTDTSPDKNAAAIPITIQYHGVVIDVFSAS